MKSDDGGVGEDTMPLYRLRYVVDTALQFPNDVALEYADHKVIFLLSQKKDAEITTHVSVDIEGTTYREADSKAQSFLQPVLDAVAFSTGTPLLVLHWDFVLKAETGSRTRQAIWCEKTRQLVPFRLTQNAIDEAQKILLAKPGPALELCWHRYAAQRTLMLDRFVFQWLAFEGLAGKKHIPTTCPQCRAEVTHCEKSLSHEGSDAQRAHQLYSQIEPNTSAREFKRDIWGKARNSVFHGSKYPAPDFLGGLNALSPKLRQACDLEFNRQYALPGKPRPVQDPELHRYGFNMFEWQTADSQRRFADDFPWAAVIKEFGDMKSGEVRSGDPQTWAFKPLNFANDAENW